MLKSQLLFLEKKNLKKFVDKPSLNMTENFLFFKTGHDYRLEN